MYHWCGRRPNGRVDFDPTSQSPYQRGRISYDISKTLSYRSVVKFASKGSMTSKLFSFWLSQIFAPESRRNCNPYDWILLLLEIWTYYIVLVTFSVLNEKKLFWLFPPDSTLLISPLDVALIWTLKKKLDLTLATLKELTYATIASWLETCSGHCFYEEEHQKRILGNRILGWDALYTKC